MANIVGQDHYEKGKIQPIQYIHANDLNFDEGSIVKYVTRHKHKDGARDVLKIIDYAIFILQDYYHFTGDQIFDNILTPLKLKYYESRTPDSER